MKGSFPRAWEYLSRHRDQLAAREKGRFSEVWWSLSRAQNIRRWSGKKILVPYMINRLQAVYDTQGSFFVNVTTGGYGLELSADKIPEMIKDAPLYIVGLMNSRLLDHCMRQLSNHFHGGYYPANKQYLQNLPIKLPETPAEKKLAARITESVRLIMDAKLKLRSGSPGGTSPGLSDRDRGTLESEIEAHERRIDEAVFALYGVDGLPR